MTNSTVKTHKYSNGMTLVVEPMSEVSSAAFAFLVPAGSGRDPESRTGAATVLTELMFRGAGDMDNRALNEALDGLGLHRHSSVSDLHCSFSGALVADNLNAALETHARVIMNPTLAADEFPACRDLALQGLDSLDDDPRQKISLLIRQRHLPYPFGRPSCGTRSDLQSLTHKELATHFAQVFTPANTILAVAGKVDFDQLRDIVDAALGSWQGSEPTELTPGNSQAGMFHEPNEGAQVHIGIMYPSATFCDDDYYAALAASAVLSGGMGSRLFTEVREKRGLCYAVGAAHQVTGPFGAVRCYLGSTPENAQQALDVTLNELRRLADGIEQDELDRAKVGLRASLVMQGESTSARAAGCAGDYHYLGRVRSLTEIEQAIKSLTVDQVVEHAKKHKPRDFTVATIGPTELKMNN